MTLDDILADVPFDMTADMERLFKVAGCEPTCHSCLDPINIGESFELAAADDGTDKMLCGGCTIQDYERRTAERAGAIARKSERQRQQHFDRTGHWPGYSRLSKPANHDEQMNNE